MENLKKIRNEIAELKLKIDTMKKRLKVLENEQETELTKIIEKGE